MNKRHAFTLIELLVVIAIIAILVSILMPSLAKAKELGKRISCLTNQHGIAMAAKVYASEFNGCFPISDIPDPANPNNYISMACAFSLRSDEPASIDIPLGMGLLVAGNYVQAGDNFHCPSLDNRSSTWNPGRGMNIINPDENLLAGQPLGSVGASWFKDPAYASWYVLTGYVYRQPSFSRTGGPTVPYPGVPTKATEANIKSTSILLVDQLDFDFGFRRFGHRDSICRTFGDGHGNIMKDAGGSDGFVLGTLKGEVTGVGIHQDGGVSWPSTWGRGYHYWEEYLYGKMEQR